MKTLLILRHAKSSWNDARLSDHERPLNTRGKQDAPRMGRLLRDEDLTPQMIISSSAKRAMTTARLVAENCDYEEEIVITRNLYHGAPEDYVAVLQDLGREMDTVMVVGHNPGLEELVDELTGEDMVMPTAALVQVSLPINSWKQLSLETIGKLEKYWLPKDLA